MLNKTMAIKTKLQSKVECRLAFVGLMADLSVLKEARRIRSLDVAASYRDLSIEAMSEKIIDGTLGVPKTASALFESMWHDFGCDNDRSVDLASDEKHNRVELLEFAQDAARMAARAENK